MKKSKIWIDLLCAIKLLFKSTFSFMFKNPRQNKIIRTNMRLQRRKQSLKHLLHQAVNGVSNKLKHYTYLSFISFIVIWLVTGPSRMIWKCVFTSFYSMYHFSFLHTNLLPRYHQCCPPFSPPPFSPFSPYITFSTNQSFPNISFSYLAFFSKINSVMVVYVNFFLGVNSFAIPLKQSILIKFARKSISDIPWKLIIMFNIINWCLAW